MDSNSDTNFDVQPVVLSLSYPRDTIVLTIPSMNTMLEGLRSKLEQNFRFVSVEYVICPDLRMFGFTAPGLAGNTMILEVGNRNNLFPTPQLHKKYAFTDIIRQLNRQNDNNFVIGAGKHSCPPLYDIAEFYANMNIKPLWFNEADRIYNKNYAIWWNEEKSETEYIRGIDPICSMHGNFFMSKGYSGLVYRIEASGRIGSRDYLTCIHDALICVYPTQPIGLGGVFMGLSDMTYHVTPSRSTSSLNTTDDIQNWLKYSTFNCPLTASGIILNSSSLNNGHLFQSFQLYDETKLHFHAFSSKNTGGHIYPSDNYPSDNNIHYIGYFSVAEKLQLDFKYFLAIYGPLVSNFIHPAMHNA